jgi:hypothetical protein
MLERKSAGNFRKRSSTYPGASTNVNCSTEVLPSLSLRDIESWLETGGGGGGVSSGVGGGDNYDLESQKSPLAMCCFINRILCDRENHIQLNLKPLSFMLKFLSPEIMCILLTLANVGMLTKIIYDVFKQTL